MKICLKNEKEPIMQGWHSMLIYLYFFVLYFYALKKHAENRSMSFAKRVHWYQKVKGWYGWCFC